MGRFVRISRSSREVLQRRHAAEFQAANKEGNGQLSMDEFQGMIPSSVLKEHGGEEVQRWFAAMDKQGVGAASITDYFMWSLGAADRATGGGAVAGFRKFDLDRSGMLDELEFSQAVEGMGYGEYTRDLFVEFAETTRQGAQIIDYRKIVRCPLPFWSTACTLEGVYR